MIFNIKLWNQYIISFSCLMISIVFGVLVLTVTAKAFATHEWVDQLSSTSEHSSEDPKCNFETVCKQINLSNAYGYKGIVRTGYLEIKGRNGSAFAFTFYGKTNLRKVSVLKTVPTIIWLGGGPGISTQFNNFEEVGPLILTKKFSLSVELNKYTWGSDYNLLFIDQPVGTGLSCAAFQLNYADSMTRVVDDLYQGLNQLYNTDRGCFEASNLDIPGNSPVFIFGEGFAGKYAPAIAAKIVQENKAGRGFLTGLRGIGIGDGFTNPIEIFRELGNHAYHMSLLDYQERVRLEKILLRSYIHYNQGKWEELTTDFVTALKYIQEKSGVDYHNIQNQHLSAETAILVEEYFSSPENLELLGFDSVRPFTYLNEKVFGKLAHDVMKTQVTELEYVLEEGLAVLIYQGQDDIIVSSSGTMRWVDQINYSHKDQFRGLDLQAWYVDGQIVGSQKSAGRLSLKVIHNAGHFVPKDSPKAAHFLATEFIERYK